MKSIKQLLKEIDRPNEDFIWTKKEIKEFFNEIDFDSYYDIDYNNDVIKINIDDVIVGDELVEKGGTEEAPFSIENNQLVISFYLDHILQDMYDTIETIIEKKKLSEKYDVSLNYKKGKIIIDIIPQ